LARGGPTVGPDEEEPGRAVEADERFPPWRLGSDDRVAQLRYGENPHQSAALYADRATTEPSVIATDQLNPTAKSLSYNNYNDADTALALVREFEHPAAAIIKHANPAGCAVGGTVAEAYDRALRTDEMSAFGGIIAINRRCDASTAARVTGSYKEVMLAPGYTEKALEVFREQEALRVLDLGEPVAASSGSFSPVEQAITGGRLVQDRDQHQIDGDDLEIPTRKTPTASQRETMAFAWRVVKHVKSNAIVLATDDQTVGIGMGQVSRVDAVRLAVRKAEEHAIANGPAGTVMASDAFFPFPDGLEVAADAGVEAVVQPGGSVNDEAVIEAANEYGLAMAFTGQRAFRHG
jgi:phosphoribosylaminoimidazolecarboxamide formyltransferase/IMP cyclohydrolase